jgi:hemerythrin-like domain-containing protein
MNKATQNLEDDHVFILELVEIMQKMAASSSVNPEQVEEVVHIIRNFADGLHHAKEENLLFPLMVEKGFSTEAGPVAVMLSDHEQGRHYVKEMADGALALKAGNSSATGWIREAMRGYADLLQAHIAKENNVLFRMADQIMSHSEESDLISRFVLIDKGNDADAVKNNYIQRIKLLKDTVYNP